MEYPEKVMRARDLAKHLGLKASAISCLYHYPGQNFAWKQSDARNSPILIDTESYEKWRIRQIKLARRVN